jgi:hypothetical protein
MATWKRIGERKKKEEWEMATNKLTKLIIKKGILIQQFFCGIYLSLKKQINNLIVVGIATQFRLIRRHTHCRCCFRWRRSYIMSLVFAPFFNHVVIDDHSMDTLGGKSFISFYLCV